MSTQDSPGPSSLAYASDYHTPIMVAEVLEALQVGPGALYVDATLGGGGHAEAILEVSSPDGRVLGIDRDPQAIAAASARLARFGPRFIPHQANYSQAPEVLERLGLGRADGMLLDAGVSSHQLDDPSRGFSFRAGGPLDMRMGEEGATLAQWLDEVDRQHLCDVLREYGEVQGAWGIARAILEARRDGRLTDTAALRAVIHEAAPGATGRRSSIDPATLVFQALRIELNDELTHLERAVDQLPEVIAPGGRGVFIAFHSLEDRIVKHGMRELANDCTCPPGLPVCLCDTRARVEILGRKPRRPGHDEIEANPRARSALLRVARVL